eukprot:TRINITY_DN29263_c0_g1_i1.p1 TRINITY_DN29263_c0_g1~~TRINITY_DN29263_c0_g1_i1.p1  ORF type:complete len:225 (+),score=24.44 TRINITY_DN29263_c0_g1_i1:57-731(+)
MAFLRSMRLLKALPASGAGLWLLGQQRLLLCETGGSDRPPTSWTGLQAYARDQRGEVAAGRGPARNAAIEERYKRYFRWAKGRGHSGAQYIVQTAQWRSEAFGVWVALEPNIVPYNVEADVEHWNLWYHPGTTPGTSDLDVDAAFSHLRLFLPSLREEDVVIFQNVPEFRSIPEVAHMHVFIRTRPGSRGEGELRSLRQAWRMRSPWAEAERLGGRGVEVGFTS